MKNIHPIRSYQKLHRLGFSSAAVAIFSVGCAGNPPTEQMAVSKVAVSNASSVNASELAPLQLRSAMDKMDAAERAMTEEDYVLARQMAEEAQVDAQLAAATARSAKAQKAVSALQEDNRVLRKEIDRKSPL